MKSVDVNRDGLLDLNFSGIVASYCTGLEKGYGRTDRKLLKLDKINYSFILHQSNENIFKYTGKYKDSICNLFQ